MILLSYLVIALGLICIYGLGYLHGQTSAVAEIDAREAMA